MKKLVKKMGRMRRQGFRRMAHLDKKLDRLRHKLHVAQHDQKILNAAFEAMTSKAEEGDKEV